MSIPKPFQVLSAIGLGTYMLENQFQMVSDIKFGLKMVPFKRDVEMGLVFLFVGIT
jgi:hypothetical protein